MLAATPVPAPSTRGAFSGNQEHPCQDARPTQLLEQEGTATTRPSARPVLYPLKIMPSARVPHPVCILTGNWQGAPLSFTGYVSRIALFLLHNEETLRFFLERWGRGGQSRFSLLSWPPHRRRMCRLQALLFPRAASTPVPCCPLSVCSLLKMLHLALISNLEEIIKIRRKIMSRDLKS